MKRAKVKAAGGKTVIADLVAPGDRVSVSFIAGDYFPFDAKAVRITAKGTDTERRRR